MSADPDEARNSELVNHVLRTVFAVADGDLDALPSMDAIGMIDNAEGWAMTCCALELIRRLISSDPENPPDGTAIWMGPADANPADQRAFTIIAKYLSGDKVEAMEWWFLPPDDVAAKANARIIEIAAGLVRQKRSAA